MKRYIRSDSKIKPTANVYAVADAMGWSKPNMTRNRTGYTCRANWHPQLSVDEWPCMEGFLLFRYREDVKPQIDAAYPVEYGSPTYVEDAKAHHAAWEQAMRELKPLAIADMQSVVDDIEKATGVQCTFSKQGSGYLVVPYAD